MTEDKVIRNARKIEAKLQKVLAKNFKNSDMEFIFKVGLMALSSLNFHFISSLVKDGHPDQVSGLIDEWAKATKAIMSKKNKEGSVKH